MKLHVLQMATSLNDSPMTGSVRLVRKLLPKIRDGHSRCQGQSSIPD